MGKLDGRVALITGSSKGIGKAIAELFAEEGAKVVINSRHLKDATRTAGKIGKGAHPVEADVSRAEDVRRMVKETVKKFGKLDILVNNAGILKGGRITEITEEDWDTVLDINLKGQFLCTKEAIPHLVKRKGVIINISSIAGEVGFEELGHYCASKGGIIEFTRALALELAHKGVRVNCIAPGVIKTDMTADLLKDPKTSAGFLASIPMGRAGRPEEMATVALFLASDDSSYMTGQIISADGGWTTR